MDQHNHTVMMILNATGLRSWITEIKFEPVSYFKPIDRFEKLPLHEKSQQRFGHKNVKVCTITIYVSESLPHT